VGWTVAIGVGVIIGAPLGARLSNRLGGVWIIRGLAGALALVALRLSVLGLSGAAARRRARAALAFVEQKRRNSCNRRAIPIQ
jgi:predicted MFS family arabinose efflux permease